MAYPSERLVAYPKKTVGRAPPPPPIRPQVGEVWVDYSDICWLIIHEDTTSEDRSLALTARACDKTGRELHISTDTFATDGTGGTDGRTLASKVVPTKVMYLNVYEKGNSADVCVHSSRALADAVMGASRRNACVRVEYIDGQRDE